MNYRRHAFHVLHNYSAEGNHLLFEAQRMIYAGVFFPEFKEAASWRESGIKILNREIEKQVYEDGGQYELDLGYHAACIDIFQKALFMAESNGFHNEFPQSYIKIVERMIVFFLNLNFLIIRTHASVMPARKAHGTDSGIGVNYSLTMNKYAILLLWERKARYRIIYLKAFSLPAFSHFVTDGIKMPQ